MLVATADPKFGAGANPAEESTTDDDLVRYLAVDILPGDYFTYLNNTRETRGTIKTFDTNDDGSVGFVIDVTGTAVCCVDSTAVVMSTFDQTIVLKTGCSEILVVGPPTDINFSF
jgi:hypothetical protein